MKLLLVSHGDLAAGMASVLSNFFGMSEVSSACVSIERGAQGLAEDVTAFFDACGDEQVVICSDLMGGSANQTVMPWLGRENTIIVAGMSVAIFGSILNLFTAFRIVEPEKIKLIYTLRGTRLQALTKAVIPSSIPALISTMKVNIGLCLVGVIIGEFLAARQGLGYLIIYASQTFKLDWLLMSIVLLCIMAMALYAVIGVVEKLYMKRL